MENATSQTTDKKKAKTQVDALKAAGLDASRGASVNLYPEDLVLIRDPKHSLYEPRLDEELEEEMVLDIEERGVIQNLNVRKNGTDSDGKPIIQVITGNRRTMHAIEANKRRVAKGLPRHKVPCVFQSGSDSEMILLRLAENAHRKDETMMTRAVKIKAAVKCGSSLDEIALALGCSPLSVQNHLDFLNLAPEVQKAMLNEDLPVGAIPAFADVPRENQATYMQQMVEAGITKNHEIKEAVKKMKKGEKPEKLAKKMWPRPALERLLKEVEKSIEAHKAPSLLVGRALINLILTNNASELKPFKELHDAVSSVKRRNRG